MLLLYYFTRYDDTTIFTTLLETRLSNVTNEIDRKQCYFLNAGIDIVHCDTSGGKVLP